MFGVRNFVDDVGAWEGVFIVLIWVTTKGSYLVEAVRLILGDGGRLEERNCCGVVGKLIRGFILDHCAERGKSQRIFVNTTCETNAPSRIA